MSGGYTKLFSSILHSTVWRESNHVRLVWVTLLALVDQDGRVEASLPGIADAARVTIQECEEALSRLSAPDQYSRTREHEGRRIAIIDGGWALLNHAKYREKSSIEERKEKAAERKRNQRERDQKRDTSRSVTPGHAPSRSVRNVPQSHGSDTDTKADQDPPVAPPAEPGQETQTEPDRPKRRKPKIPIPTSWTPNAAHSSKSATLGLNLDAEARKFRNNAEGKDVRWVDWDKAFHNWLDNGAVFTRPGMKAPGLNEHEKQLAERDAVLLDEIKRGEWGPKAQAVSLVRPVDLRRFREAIHAGKVARTPAGSPATPLSPKRPSQPPPGGVQALLSGIGRNMPL